MPYLVPVRSLDVSIPHDEHHGEPLYLWMPRYVCTANDLPVPVHDELACSIGDRLYGALQLLWQCKYFHCDVKPQNVFIDSAGVVRLGDYGSVMSDFSTEVVVASL